MQTPRTSTLATIIADWQARCWPTHTLALFRMEGGGGASGAAGTGAAGAAGDGGQGGGDGGQGGGGGGAGEGAGGDAATELEKWKAEARKHEQRAKANATAARELEQLKATHMTEQEKAIEQARTAAKAEARLEAFAELGGQLVSAEVRATAAGRMSAEQIATLVDGLNVAAFLTDAGEVDKTKVATFVDGIAPKPNGNGGNGGGNGGGTGFPDLGQGSRGGGQNGNEALNGDPLQKALERKLGVR